MRIAYVEWAYIDTRVGSHVARAGAPMPMPLQALPPSTASDAISDIDSDYPSAPQHHCEVRKDKT